MGRKTLESFPDKKPLRNRTNIVLTTDVNYQVEGATVVHSVEKLRKELEKYDTDNVYVIGGGSIYKTLLDDCDTALVTYIDYEFDDADTFFPNLEEKPEWSLKAKSLKCVHAGMAYSFRTYEKDIA